MRPGTPVQGFSGEFHVLVEQETAYAGMSRFGDVANPEPWTLPERETLLVLEGVARIDIQHGGGAVAAGAYMVEKYRRRKAAAME
jgi:hypothetical protein